MTDQLDALRAWLIDQSKQARYLAEHPDGQPGDPGGYFDKGVWHMADATLTWLSERREQDLALASSEPTGDSRPSKGLRKALTEIAAMLPGSVPLPMTEEEYLRAMLHEAVRTARRALIAADSRQSKGLTVCAVCGANLPNEDAIARHFSDKAKNEAAALAAPSTEPTGEGRAPDAQRELPELAKLIAADWNGRPDLRAPLRRALVQWRMYADEKRGPHAPPVFDAGRREQEPFDYIEASDDPSDIEAEMYREAKAALAAPLTEPTGEGRHRMGPPKWEPGDPQDGWTNRCLGCGARWTVDGCPNATGDSRPCDGCEPCVQMGCNTHETNPIHPGPEVFADSRQSEGLPRHGDQPCDPSEAAALRDPSVWGLSCLGCGQIGKPSTVQEPTGIYLCERCVAAIRVADSRQSEGLPDYLAEKDRSADEHRDPSDCPKCGEWRDSPDADCASCGFTAAAPKEEPHE